MVTDQEIAEGLESIFRETNPNSFNSLNDVILRLQSHLGGFDLSHKIDFIRTRISLLFSAAATAQQQQHQQSVPVTVQQQQQQQQPVVSRPNPNLNVNVGVTHVPHPQQQQQNNNPGIGRHAPSMVGGHGLNISMSGGHPPNLNMSGGNLSMGGGHVSVSMGMGGHVFNSPSHFPRGPTEISFAQPGSVTVVSDSLSSPQPAKDSQRPKRRGGPGGLNKLCGVSPQLQTIVGQPTMPRTEIVKQLWAYIRKNNLQDPSNKRKIICNEELRLVFEVDCTDMFQMNKLLAKHILPLDSKKDSGQQSKKLKVEEPQAPSSEPEPKPEPEPEPEPAPIVISEALAKFFGTSKKEMLPSEVYKSIEEYIKTEGLEDALNSTVVCDTKLQELLGCESITVPEIREALARNHLFQQA